jgi:hypothetical protein
VVAAAVAEGNSAVELQYSRFKPVELGGGESRH